METILLAIVLFMFYFSILCWLFRVDPVETILRAIAPFFICTPHTAPKMSDYANAFAIEPTTQRKSARVLNTGVWFFSCTKQIE